MTVSWNDLDVTHFHEDDTPEIHMGELLPEQGEDDVEPEDDDADTV